MAEVDTFSTIDQQRELIEERGIRADQIDALQNFVRKPGEVGTIGPLNVQYPENDVEQWCNIAIYEYVYRAESEKTLKHGLGNVKLPLPLQLQTQYQQQWNNFDNLVSLGVGSYTSGASVSDTIKNVALTQEAAALIGAGIGSIPGIGGGLGTVIGAVGATNISQGLTALGGVAANKFETVTYQKPELRQHQFSWNLTAKSRSEGIAIQNIIKKLKYHSHPDGGNNSGAYFRYPEVFVVKFFSDQNLFTIGPSVLESFGVDYHASGRPLYQASDRMPINVAINCSFRETAAVTKNSIEKESR
jgi:hypothetical protein